MNAEDQAFNALVWIESLKTGGYKQGENVLGEWENGYCCLGLACSVTNVPYNPITAFPSPLLSERVGLRDTVGQCDYKFTKRVRDFLCDGEHYETNLVEINDCGRYTFKHIATLLSKVPEAYFTPEVAAIIKETYA